MNQFTHRSICFQKWRLIIHPFNVNMSYALLSTFSPLWGEQKKKKSLREIFWEVFDLDKLRLPSGTLHSCWEHHGTAHSHPYTSHSFPLSTVVSSCVPQRLSWRKVETLQDTMAEAGLVKKKEKRWV